MAKEKKPFNLRLGLLIGTTALQALAGLQPAKATNYLEVYWKMLGFPLDKYARFGI